MNKADLEKTLKEYLETSAGNYIEKDSALRPDLAGMRIFDEPLVGYASVTDPYFSELKKPGVIGTHFMAPEEWLPGAKTVIAFFFPFTEQVCTANSSDMVWPTDEWLHARYEGQNFLDVSCRFMEDLLKKEGYWALAPLLDSRFSRTSPLTKDETKEDYYTSNWSERHVAYIAGLGTFGLSRSLITRKGPAGRCFSIITDAFFEPDGRPYAGIYDYCTNCGSCISKCPAKAISKEQGKLHYPCGIYVDLIGEKYSPRRGCGKCQVKVPCGDGTLAFLKSSL